MKNKLFTVLMYILCINTVFCTAGVSAATRTDSALTYYVAPDGDDTADGTIDAPLATMSGARDRIREFKEIYGYPDGGITVYFRGGKYKITEKIDFDERDSGTAEYPVIYSAYKDEKPIFTGGYYLKGSDFEPVRDTSVLNRFPTDDARRKVVCYDLKANGITEYGEIPNSFGTNKNGIHNNTAYSFKTSSMGVYVDDKAFRLARYPNYTDDNDKGWLFVEDVINSGPAWEWQRGLTPQFTYSDMRLENWASYDDIHLAGILNWQYFYDDAKVREINKTTKTIILDDTIVSGAAENGKYYLYNILDELDDPGEYYIDRTNGILYLYPTENFENAEVKLSAYEEQLMIDCQKLSHCVFKGLTFELTKANVANVVGGDSVNFSCCTFKNLGIRAVILGASHVADGAVDRAPDLEGELAKCYDNEANGINHSVTSCEMFNLGFGGVKMIGGDIYHLQSANFSVENCEIHDFGQLEWGYDQGINYYGRGFRIRNNKIYNAPMGAVQGQAMDVIFEYNEMYNVVRYTSDAGAIYTNYTWPIHDVYIRYNYIHDIPDSKLPHEHTYWDGGTVMKAAIYTDTEMLSSNIYGNVIANVPIGYSQSGQYGKIENNIFIDCQRFHSAWIDKAGLKGWSGAEALGSDSASPFRFAQYFPWDSKEWRKAYPDFFKEWDYIMSKDDIGYFKDRLIRNLVIYNKHPEWKSINMPEHLLRYSEAADEYIYEDNIVTTEDPGFVDMQNGDYRLKDDAVIYKTLPQFEKIDIAKMGLLTAKVGADLSEDPVEFKPHTEAAGQNISEMQEVSECKPCSQKN